MYKPIIFASLFIFTCSTLLKESPFPRTINQLQCDKVITDNVNYACYNCGQKFEEPVDQLKCINTYLNQYYGQSNWQSYWYDPRGTCGTVGALDYYDDCYLGYQSTFVWRSPKDKSQQHTSERKSKIVEWYNLMREKGGCDSAMISRAYNFVSTCSSSGSMGEQLKCIQSGLNAAYPETRWQALSFRPICGAVYNLSIVNECKVEASTGDFNIVVWRYI